MATKQEHVAIHMPKYETRGLHFNTPTPNVTVDIADVQNYIREKAEAKLEQCASFEVSLPPSITGITTEENRIEFKDLFQTPTLNELEMVSTNPDGSPIKLNDQQLKAVRQTGEFEVNSIHFTGQRHRWKLSRLLQSGIQCANERFFKELSWALYMLIIFARDRVLSNTFSFKATLRSWRQGLVSLLDAIIGLPALYSHGIDVLVENERLKFLVIELSPHESEKTMHEAFCAQIPVLLEMMAEEKKNLRGKEKTIPPKMLPYPHQFVTPNNNNIDLRLHNPDLQTKIQDIVSILLIENTPKNWYNVTKRRLINEYKHAETESHLSKQEIAKRVQAQLNSDYAELVFQMIENSHELEQLSPGLGRLLVAQARSVLVMKSVVDTLTADLDKHLKDTREKLLRAHPIKSKISRWLDRQLLQERLNYIHKHEWDAHQQSIEQCKALGNQQAAYFIQRDLTFRKDHESILRHNLKPPREPIRTITCHRAIWFPKNWIVERNYPLPVERIPTIFVDRHCSNSAQETLQRLLANDPHASYQLRRNVTYTTTTRYPFWRWRLLALRTFSWLSNAIFGLCLVVPFASPVSFRALFSPKPFFPNYELDDRDLKLHPVKSSKTQTFVSRLVALWRNVRQSRRNFEQTPDRGFLGKNMQRVFNRIWNYFGKGVIGTIAICAIYPISCLTISTLSFAAGVLSPIWMPIVSLIFHILQILFYDANSAGEYAGKLFCLINIILTDFFLCGIVQPILVLISLVASPLVALLLVLFALLHRCTRGLYDTLIFHLIVKRFARVPAHNSFLARRTAGPGLAAEYFFQVSPPEVLAALESLIEQNELKVYRNYIERLLMKPIEEYRNFFNAAFHPFSAIVQKTDPQSVFNRMNDTVDKHIQNLKAAIDRRYELLRVQRAHNHDRIRLTEADLTAVLIEGSELVEEFYPKRIFTYLTNNEIEKFWNDLDLEVNDWLGVASKLLQDLFCRDFLTPLEQTDVFYSLKVDHITLSKYARMIDSANLHDDLDVVTSVYLPETSFNIQQPSFDTNFLNPNERILDISTNYSEKLRPKTHGRMYRHFNRQAKYLTNATKLARFVDYTSITCRFSIPIRLPDVIYVNILVFNRDNNNNAHSNTSIKTITPQDVLNLITYIKKYHPDLMLPIFSPMISSVTTLQTMTTDDAALVTHQPEHDDEPLLTSNIVVLDEQLL